MRKKLLTAAVAAAVLSTPAFAQRYPSDPFAPREAAMQAMAADPLGAAHLAHAMAMRTRLGLSTADTFTVISVSPDDLGGSHARLQQYFQGVKVLGGTLLTHVDARGAFQPDTDAVVRGLALTTTPAIPLTRALSTVAQLASHQYAYSWDPRTELVIEPIFERVLASNGRPVPATEFDRTDPDSQVDALTALDVVRRMTGARLLWSIHTVEGREGSPEPINEMDYAVDASTGALAHETALGSTATGNGFRSGLVSLQTQFGLGGFALVDTVRNFRTLDSRNGVFSPPNVDPDDTWGDGAPFIGDFGGNVTNRQSAMVDGHFGASVYWDLMSNVFKRKGPDGKSFPVNINAHVGWGTAPLLVWDNANYSPATASVQLGDGANRTFLDCLGHEEGHGLVDFTARLSGTPGSGFNESMADVAGSLTNLYLQGNGFANKSTSVPPGLPGTANPFVSRCSGRNMVKPTRGTGADRSDFWYPGIENLPDVHDVAQPNNRAFFFFAQGASPFMKATSYSPRLPWGMTGIGNDLAGRIWFEALTHWMVSNPEYTDVRQAMFMGTLIKAAGANLQTTIDALTNAYAGISVGNTTGNYPAAPAPMLCGNNNFTRATAQAITLPAFVAGSTKPSKLKLMCSGSASRFFTITISPTRSATVRLDPVFANDDWDLFVTDELGGITPSTAGHGKFDLLDFAANGGINGQTQTLVIEVKPYKLTNAVGTFVLDFDRY